MEGESMSRYGTCYVCHSPTTEYDWHGWKKEDGTIVELCERCHWQATKDYKKKYRSVGPMERKEAERRFIERVCVGGPL